MKLLYCKKCSTVFNLKAQHRQGECGKTKGKYTDNLNAIYCGRYAIPFAIDNYSFAARAKNDKGSAWFYDTLHGKDGIQAWIMPRGNPNYHTIKKLTEKAYLKVAFAHDTGTA